MADRHEAATDLGTLFRTRIRPALEPLEAERRRLLMMRRLFDVAFLAAAAAMVAGLVAVEAQPTPWYLAIATGAVVFPLARWKIGEGFLDRARQNAVAAIAEALGVTYDAVGSWFSTYGFHEAEIVRTHNRSELEHLVTGRRRGTEYAMVRASLVSGEGEHQTTVFTGLLFRIGVPIDFEGTVLLARSHGPPSDMLRAQNPTRFEPFSTPFPDFSEFYQVFTDAPDVARRLIGRAVADDLVGLALAQEFRDFTAAFVNGKFLLALPTQRKLLSFGRLGRPFIGVEEDLEQIVRDLQIAERLIDHLHGRDSGPLVL